MLVRKVKKAVLTTLVTGGMLLGWSCGWNDVGYNVLAGTQAFVKAYTTDLWEALIPAADELVNFDAAE